MDENSDYRNSPVAWFAALERARHIDDFELAAEAQRQLRRLGVIVTYPKQQKARNKLSHKLLNFCRHLYSVSISKLQITDGKSKKA